MNAFMNAFTHTVASMLLLAAASAASAQSPTPARGALLYETHCIGCHTEQMHWRKKRVASDWPSLLKQVRRWQGSTGQRWNDEDIDAVARYLNERHYRYDTPARPRG